MFSAIFRKEYRLLIVAALLCYCTLLFFITKEAFWYDAICWEKWGILIQKHGLAAVYDKDLSDVNYMPMYLYVLKVWTWLCGEQANLGATVHYLKAVPLFFEVLSVTLLASMVRNAEHRLFWLIAGVMNIGMLYNTMFWHQVDGILAFFLLLSFVFAMRGNDILSVIIFVIAFNFKIQGVMLLPLLGLMWLQRITIRRLGILVFSALAVQFLIILPFIIYGNARNIPDIVFNSYNHYEEVSKNAHNIWYLVLNESPVSVSDKNTFLGMSYHAYGLGLYIAAVLMLIAPLILILRKKRHYFKAEQHTKFFVLTAALLPYVFFYFNTQMHERYIHCAMIFILWLAMAFGHFRFYIFFTLVYFLSLDKLLRDFGLLNHWSWLYNEKLSAACFTSGLIYLSYLWFRELRKVKRQISY